MLDVFTDVCCVKVECLNEILWIHVAPHQWVLFPVADTDCLDTRDPVQRRGVVWIDSGSVNIIDRNNPRRGFL